MILSSNNEVSVAEKKSLLPLLQRQNTIATIVYI